MRKKEDDGFQEKESNLRKEVILVSTFFKTGGSAKPILSRKAIKNTGL